MAPHMIEAVEDGVQPTTPEHATLRDCTECSQNYERSDLRDAIDHIHRNHTQRSMPSEMFGLFGDPCVGWMREVKHLRPQVQ
ncbi:hypothetical protein ColKHC_09124 [Colletotrichum higginsianum]|nr:hypothetical protein ColKHC_09124 [Colletotrichum higginsianum]